MLTSNMARWRYYLKDITSPDLYIEWALYSMVASALQRKVWTGSLRKPLFFNLYVTLVGEPGIGKGLVITEVSKALRSKSMLLSKEEDAKIVTKDDAVNKKRRGENKVKYLIPIGPDASTYEALVKIMSGAYRIHYHSIEIELDGKKMKKSIPYAHSSLTLCLEEMSSLFRKHTEDLVNFLLVAYDCGPYTYETISRGADDIQACCLNLFAGTTPGFIKRVFGDELLTDGFASRTVFVFAEKNRFERARPAEFSEDQIKEYDKVLEHIRKLAGLFGEVAFTSEAIEYLETWWQTAKLDKINKSVKLFPYYARKAALVQKMAAIIHFIDSLTLEVGLEDIKNAIAICEHTEAHMHMAITQDTINPEARVTQDIVKYIATNQNTKGYCSKKRILIDHYGQLPEGEASLDRILNFLLYKSEQIELEEKGKTYRIKMI